MDFTKSISTDVQQYFDSKVSTQYPENGTREEQIAFLDGLSIERIFSLAQDYSYHPFICDYLLSQYLSEEQILYLLAHVEEDTKVVLIQDLLQKEHSNDFLLRLIRQIIFLSSNYDYGDRKMVLVLHAWEKLREQKFPFDELSFKELSMIFKCSLSWSHTSSLQEISEMLLAYKEIKDHQLIDIIVHVKKLRVKAFDRLVAIRPDYFSFKKSVSWNDKKLFYSQNIILRNMSLKKLMSLNPTIRQLSELLQEWLYTKDSVQQILDNNPTTKDLAVMLGIDYCADKSWNIFVQRGPAPLDLSILICCISGDRDRRKFELLAWEMFFQSSFTLEDARYIAENYKEFYLHNKKTYVDEMDIYLSRFLEYILSSATNKDLTHLICRVKPHSNGNFSSFSADNLWKRFLEQKPTVEDFQYFIEYASKYSKKYPFCGGNGAWYRHYAKDHLKKLKKKATKK